MVIQPSGFLDFKDGASIVVAARGANLMRRPFLVALGAVHQVGQTQGVAGAALVPAGFRMAASGVGHGLLLSWGDEVSQRDPAQIRIGGASAGALVQVGTATGAQAFAVLTAEDLLRHFQVHLLGHEVFELQNILVIVSDFVRSARNVHGLFHGCLGGGPIFEREGAGSGHGGRRETAGTGGHSRIIELPVQLVGTLPRFNQQRELARGDGSLVVEAELYLERRHALVELYRLDHI
jgi:hypothetical protein